MTASRPFDRCRSAHSHLHISTLPQHGSGTTPNEKPDITSLLTGNDMKSKRFTTLQDAFTRTSDTPATKYSAATCETDIERPDPASLQDTAIGTSRKSQDGRSKPHESPKSPTQGTPNTPQTNPQEPSKRACEARSGRVLRSSHSPLSLSLHS